MRERGELCVGSPGGLYPKCGESSEDAVHVAWRRCSCDVFPLEKAEDRV